MVSKRLKKERLLKLEISNSEIDCQKCGVGMQRRKHKNPPTNKAYYFSEWDYCKYCKHVQHYDKFKCYKNKRDSLFNPSGMNVSYVDADTMSEQEKEIKFLNERAEFRIRNS